MSRLYLLLAAMIGLCSLSSCARGRSAASSSPSNQQVVTRPATVTGREANVAFTAQAVDVDFVAAWSRYQEGDRAGAGGYLDRAATTLGQQGGNPVHIQGLSQRLKSGGAVSEGEFEKTFAWSHRALADVRRGQANEYLTKQNEQAAGESMEAMAYHTERSAEWSGQKLSEQEQAEVSNLRRVGGALRTGSGYLVKGSGFVVQGTGWVLGKGFSLLTKGGERTVGRAGSVISGTGRGGETGSGWIKSAGSGIGRFGDWILRRDPN